MTVKDIAKGEVILYDQSSRKAGLEVHLENDTVWLTQKQMADLFDTERSVITKHLGNIFSSKELDKNLVCAKFAHTAFDGKLYQTQYYNLDAIISVGYRVNSQRGTQFRIWATGVLKDHLVMGYTLNEKRLKQEIKNYRQLQKTISTIGRVLDRGELNSDQTTGLLRVITDFSYALTILDDYDYQRLEVTGVSRKKGKELKYAEVRSIIETLKDQYKASELFGRETSHNLKSSLGNIFQTFGGKQLYPSLEEKAANLLYYLVKNHHFVDGNKRIAAFLFLWFMEKGKALYRADGTKRIADNALAAITLMIAESQPQEKDTIVKVIINLINEKN